MKATRYFVILLTVMAGLCIWAQDQVVKGNASYYSDRLHGRYMANGQKYNRDSFTCAHLKYPLGTRLKVRNPVNEKECIVTVTDRGPYHKKFLIDLSKAAARHLGILGAGFMMVEITPYYEGQVPFKLEVAEEEIPELNLEYAPAATYPEPVWQQKKDSTEVIKKIQE